MLIVVLGLLVVGIVGGVAVSPFLFFLLLVAVVVMLVTPRINTIRRRKARQRLVTGVGANGGAQPTSDDLVEALSVASRAAPDE